MKFLIRNIALIIIIILAFRLVKLRKTDIVEETIFKSFIWVGILLAIIYTFTHKSDIWRKYIWIYRLGLIIASIIYLYGLFTNQEKYTPRRWRNRVRSIISLLVFLISMIFFKNRIYKSIGY